ncbi:NAD(P)H-dependent oxidoreductase [Nonlabens agnitus]|uniref:NAD(P)H-dependent oxidoreductase n=1 Tax=Nonlabens agnitus TaxID=870484 RepID=A0A2S9WRI1_9FLAO|nr:NAD(P)H-dependent oxidoreductase [Nonlabens agnitus]PRP65896.1 NAD(P)H-dependent oxidoreductase [Nonlabens agnitus]
MTKSIENLKWRYATKNFDPNKNLEPQQLEMLAAAFNLTATSYGLQPCRLIVVQNADIQHQMVPMAFGQRQVVDASAVLVICTTAVDADYVRRYFKRVKDVRDTSDEVLQPFVDQLTTKFDAMAVEEVEQWARNQAYITLGTLMNICAQEQIDSCPMEGFIPDKIDGLLGLKAKGLKSVLMLPVGYRSAEDPFADMKKVRLPIEKSVEFIH